jgi:hypothetical protein
VVDEWPIEWASGWLLARAFEAAPVEAWKNQPVGFGGDIAGEDPWWDAPAEPPPPGWADNLPMYVPPEEVSDGE